MGQPQLNLEILDKPLWRKTSLIHLSVNPLVSASQLISKGVQPNMLMKVLDPSAKFNLVKSDVRTVLLFQWPPCLQHILQIECQDCIY